jgi:hypothetical protein
VFLADAKARVCEQENKQQDLPEDRTENLSESPVSYFETTRPPSLTQWVYRYVTELLTWPLREPRDNLCFAPQSPGIRNGRRGVSNAVGVEPKGGQM